MSPLGQDDARLPHERRFVRHHRDQSSHADRRAAAARAGARATLGVGACTNPDSTLRSCAPPLSAASVGSSHRLARGLALPADGPGKLVQLGNEGIQPAFEDAEISEEELADAQSAIVRSLPRNLETNEGMASALHSIEQYQLGLDYLERFAGFVDAVDVEQILATAEKRLQPDRCAVTVAGPYPSIDAGGAKKT